MMHHDSPLAPLPRSLLEAASATSAELLAWYAQAAAPEPGELHGEYASAFPVDRDRAVRAFFRARGRGHWLGKAYRSASDGTGEGYNLWQSAERVVRSERFAFRIAPSQLDGRPALVMRYDAFFNESGAIELVDEVRRLSPGVYVGLYSTRVAVPPFTRAQASARSAPEVFLLGAPARPWRGVDDDALETRGFRPAHALLQRITAPTLLRAGLARVIAQASAPAHRDRRPAPVRALARAAEALAHIPEGVTRALLGGPPSAGARVMDAQLHGLALPSTLLDPGTPHTSARALAAARRQLRVAAQLVAGPFIPLATRDLQVAGAGAALPARLYVPERGTRDLLVYFHGGGWVQGDLESHDALCRRLATTARLRVLSVEYRKAPEHPWPLPLEDAWAALRDVYDRVSELAPRGSAIAVGGDSAGGNLAAVLAARARRSGLALAAQLLIYPATELAELLPSRHEHARGPFLTAERMRFFQDCYVPNVALRTHPEVSPLRAALPEGLAPAVVVTAGFDPLRDEGNAYALRLREAGVVVTHLEFSPLAHGFANMLAIPSASAAVDTLARALRSTLDARA